MTQPRAASASIGARSASGLAHATESIYARLGFRKVRTHDPARQISRAVPSHARWKAHRPVLLAGTGWGAGAGG
jgi:hypothetical protein